MIRAFGYTPLQNHDATPRKGQTVSQETSWSARNSARAAGFSARCGVLAASSSAIQRKTGPIRTGTAYAIVLLIVFPRLREFLSVVAMAALLAPAATSVCAQPSARHCQGAEHACCKIPRLTLCDCGSAQSSVVAEPAQRAKNVSADTTFVVLPIDRVALVAASPRIGRLHPAASPPDTGERLSLLSILIV